MDIDKAMETKDVGMFVAVTDWHRRDGEFVDMECETYPVGDMKVSFMYHGQGYVTYNSGSDVDFLKGGNDVPVNHQAV